MLFRWLLEVIRCDKLEEVPGELVVIPLSVEDDFPSEAFWSC